MNPDLDLTLQRVIRAPRTTVWRAWTDPAQLRAVVGSRPHRGPRRPARGTPRRCARDAHERRRRRVRARTSTRSFLVVDELERLAFTNAIDSRWRPANPDPVAMVAEILLDDHPAGTDYRVIVRHGDPAARARHEEIGFFDGWGSVTEQLAALVERGSAMKITLTEFVTLDGVSQGPGSPTEDTSDGFTRGGWLVPHLDEQFVRRASEWLDLADGLLLGRRTYEAFARDWPQITDPDDPFTERMNSLPKYVVTNTPIESAWNPTTVLRGDPVQSVGALRSRPGRELQIHGSARLGGTLLSAGLVDTLRLVVAPTIIGTGRRLLDHPSDSVGLRLVKHDVTSAGLLLLEYETTGASPVAEYEGVTAFV